MRHRLLIDECLNPRLVALAKERGISADFVAHVGKQSWRDDSLVAFAVENDYAVVTNNRRDFLKQYLKYDLHPGLVIIVPLAARAEQMRLFGLALDRLERLADDTVNHLIEVLDDGSVHVREWTSDAHDLSHIASPSWPK